MTRKKLQLSSHVAVQQKNEVLRGSAVKKKLEHEPRLAELHEHLTLSQSLRINA